MAVVTDLPVALYGPYATTTRQNYDLEADSDTVTM